MRRASLFRASDFRRAIRAAQSSGLEINRVEISRDGRIVIFPGEPTKAKDHGVAAVPSEENLKDLV